MSAPMISDSGRGYLRFALCDGVGPIKLKRLLDYFGSIDAALGASVAQLQQIPGIGATTAERVARTRDTAPIEREIALAEQHGVRIVACDASDYPPGLRKIPDPPIVLYVKGELHETDAVAVAIVGTRRCSVYGSEQARRFAELLAGTGLTVVSGLARGIDAFAHHGALDAGGRTLAVLGSGLIDIYPPENRALADRLLSSGAWLSELPLAADVRRENFPSRNRIIAGLTLGTLVIEAPQRSGALITARLAAEYNREVFCIPGRLQEPAAQGANALIRDGGAKLVTDLEDILNELGALGDAFRPRGAPAPLSGEPEQPRGLPAQLTITEAQVIAALEGEAKLQDQIMAETQLPAGDVLAALTSLELKRLVKRLPGQLVQRC